MAMRTVIPIREEFSLHREPALEEMLADPLVVTVMQADRVDPAMLRAMLRRLADELRARRYVAPIGPTAECAGSFAGTPHG